VPGLGWQELGQVTADKTIVNLHSYQGFTFKSHSTWLTLAQNQKLTYSSALHSHTVLVK